MPTVHSKHAAESPATLGNTRGNATDAPLEVKCQALIIFWRLCADGMPRMEAYEKAGRLTGHNSVSSVRTWRSIDFGLEPPIPKDLAERHPL